MHVILWRFRAVPGREAEFEAAYGDDGAWVRLFRTDPGFLGSELMRGTDGVYLAVDRWVSRDAYRAFRDDRADAYAEMDARCEALTLEEAFIGAVEA
jgi:heme-degrading monooxygenase HmoA